MKKKEKIPQELLVEKSEILYEHYKTISKKLKLNPKDETFNIENCERAIVALAKKDNIFSMGRKYLWNYITYVFSKKKKKGGFKFSWLVTNPSIQLWIDKEEDWIFYHTEFLRENDLTPNEKLEEKDLLEYEDNFRKKFLNVAKGFIICLENTSLIDPRSFYCKKCFKKLDCKKILEKNNKELYEERYGRTK